MGSNGHVMDDVRLPDDVIVVTVGVCRRGKVIIFKVLLLEFLPKLDDLLT